MSNAEHSLDHCNFHSSTHYLIRLPAQRRLKGTQASLGEDSTEEGRWYRNSHETWAEIKKRLLIPRRKDKKSK